MKTPHKDCPYKLIPGKSTLIKKNEEYLGIQTEAAKFSLKMSTKQKVDIFLDKSIHCNADQRGHCRRA